ncbi:agamous-like MADS-box protein AGL61 [Phragmites australis]|uniref:agamous-like MADS-box protein AGL61 n=1 Tax=Phragmites australis TaxID=29695 RepID=UPI002D799B09|nr:agamous-like MADS-box protein AGL61 [Phragmites australis]
MTKAADRDGEAGGDRERKKTLGRQKIEIKPIKCTEARHVCFSKRRSGLFKKATELSVLCGAHVAVVVFSPAGKPFSYGHPSVDTVVERFLDPASSSTTAAADATHPPILYDFDSERDRLAQAVEAEARRREALDAAARAAGVWTNEDVQRAGMADLVAMLGALERVQAEAAERAQEIIAEEAMMHHSTTANDVFHYLGAGTFTADGGVSNHQAVMGTQTMVVGSNVGHAPPFAPMLLPSHPPPFNHGFDHNLIAGYGYDLGDGSGHGAAYEMEGLYGTTTCNFFQ